MGCRLDLKKEKLVGHKLGGGKIDRGLFFKISGISFLPLLPAVLVFGVLRVDAGVALVAVLVLVLSVVLSLLGNWFLVFKPLRSAVETLREISRGEGDLTKRVRVTGDGEIGDMARCINLLLDKMQNVIIKIKNQAATLSSIGYDLSSNMETTALAVSRIAADAQSVKDRSAGRDSAGSGSHSTMEQITDGIGELNGHIERQSATIVESSSAIEAMIANIQSVTHMLAQNAVNVNTLRESSEEGKASMRAVSESIQEIARESEGLLEINAVMGNIATQTNLLSMNAAIEAAHAGEAGRGFAVVADEIRKLAENSSAQSKRIKAVLKKMKESVDGITFSIQAVLGKFELIDDSVQTVVAHEELILGTMEEQGQGSKLVLEAVGKVNAITRQVSDGSGKMLDGSREVVQERRNAEKAMQEITAAINGMVEGARQINVAISHVNEISNKNRRNTTVLAEEVELFKVDEQAQRRILRNCILVDEVSLPK